MTRANYTGRLAAGLGMIEETLILLDLWHEGMDGAALNRAARASGHFPNLSASRLTNLIFDGFALRYLVDDGAPARLLRTLRPILARRELEQLFFLYTCRAHPILADFIREVYWPAYSAGRAQLDNEEARAFVTQANQEGSTTTPWAASMIRRVASYLTGCCADFGLLERGRRHTRRILPYRLEPRVALFLAYERHFAGLGDNSILADADWALFGLDAADVLGEFKRLALKGYVIVQVAGSVTRIGWQHKAMQEVIDVIAQGEL